MPHTFGSLAFTPEVLALQQEHGSRRQYQRMEELAAPQDRLTEFESSFIAQRDSFYWATTGSSGWPYLQHRGGPRGFLHVIDVSTLALADFRGNKQYISTGNLTTNNRVALIMVDYPRQARLKILGRVEILEGTAAEPWLDRVKPAGYKAVVERVFLIHLEAFDWNCPQHITPRYTLDEVAELTKPLRDRIQSLEAELGALKQTA